MWLICFLWSLTLEVTHILAYISNDAWSVKTYWDQDKMAAIVQAAFSNEFTRMKFGEFCFTCQWNAFFMAQLTKRHDRVGWWLGGEQATNNYVSQWWHIYTSSGSNSVIAIDTIGKLSLWYESFQRSVYQGNWIIQYMLRNIHMGPLY